MAEHGGHTEVVRAPVHHVRDALMDFEAYPRWQAGVTRCTVLERDNEGRGSLVDLYLDARAGTVRMVRRPNCTEQKQPQQRVR